MTVTPEAVLAQLHWRYASKKFDPARKIPADLWAKLEEALVLSPSSYGLQPWKFFVITNAEVREKLRAVSYGQPQITEASHLVVFSAKKNLTPADAERWVKRIAEVRKIPVESLDGMKGMMAGSIARQSAEQLEIWATRQVYIALGVFLTTAAMLGVDACPMEGFENAKYDEILGLSSQGFGSAVIAAAGYRIANDPYSQGPKARYLPQDVIAHVR